MEEESLPGSGILLIIGLLIAAVGAVLAGGASDISQAQLGNGLGWLGGGLASLGILIEFFSIGASLRRISRAVSRQGQAAYSRRPQDPAAQGPQLPAGWFDVPEKSQPGDA